MTLWDKIKTWLAGAATAAAIELSKDEAQLLALMQPLLASAEAAALQDLVTFIVGVVSVAKSPTTLDAWETAVLNGLEATGSELFALARSLGSSLLQALIGLILARLPASHPAVAG